MSKVIVGMPFFNNEKTIHHAIKSVLQQTFKDFKLVIVDDGSTDNSISIIEAIKDSRIELVKSRENKGLAFRLNEIITLSDAKYFARMDADDICYPYRLQKQYDFLEQNIQVDLVGSWVSVFKDEKEIIGTRRPPISHKDITRNPLLRIPLDHPTFFGKMNWFKKHKYDPSFSKSQDRELLLRTFRESIFANLNEILLAYREGNSNKSKILESRKMGIKAINKNFRNFRNTSIWLKGQSIYKGKQFYDFLSNFRTREISYSKPTHDEIMAFKAVLKAIE